MSTELSYGFKKTLHASVDEADARVRAALKDEGFGILTEIDVKSTLKQKLDVDFRPYRILGACNPPLAHRALTEETDIGLLLPCNVVVYAGDEEGTAVVAILDPVKQLGVAGRADMAPLAEDVRGRMKRVLEAL
ncbi:MAG: ABC transporter ATP-binding protein [Gemmatimonadota bacterium]